MSAKVDRTGFGVATGHLKKLYLRVFVCDVRSLSGSVGDPGGGPGQATGRRSRVEVGDDIAPSPEYVAVLLHLLAFVTPERCLQADHARDCSHLAENEPDPGSKLRITHARLKICQVKRGVTRALIHAPRVRV